MLNLVSSNYWQLVYMCNYEVIASCTYTTITGVIV